MKLSKAAATFTLAALATFAATSFAASDKKSVVAIESAVAGSWRSADSRERDTFRHPVDALDFWGLKPGMSILEIQPGGGWWTEILAPYARLNKGEFAATAADIADPGLSEGARKGRADFAAKYGDAAVYGKVNLVNWGSKAAPLPANKYDFVLLARALHNWANQGTEDANLAKIYASVKPGGILAVEQHRAPAAQAASVYNGYVTEQSVIDAATKAGFKLDGKSEINANAKDTKDHPFGVWTLPPVRKSADDGKPVDPAFDRAKYDAIGESDRMTLRFVKPKK
ncbi:MAG TPA: methyltransferase domain-containing protein [Steroidobacteraceae bacterium]|jgi:predicted methyltransferase|nr:methyltransferase domain-containing protein [Steroidobacteraceae bacterium]